MTYDESNTGTDMTPQEYLDAAKEKLGITSDNELAKRLDVSRQRISAYRLEGKGREWPDIAVLLRLAVILEIDPAGLIADIEAQHTKNAKKAAFLRDFASRASEVTRTARTLALAFIVGLLVVAGATGSNGASRFKRRLSCA